MNHRKKLIEVALPLEEINAACSREKSIRHGHPSTLHLWWARRPLAACRAVLFASIVDDPGEEGAPQELLEQIDRLPLDRKYRPLADEQPLGPDGEPMGPEEAAKEKLARLRRYRLFTFIERLVKWENSNDPDTLEIARNLILAACKSSCPPETDDIDVVFEEALKYNGYERYGASCADEANAVRAKFAETGAWQGSIDDLRNCLFFMQRDWRWQGYAITEGERQTFFSIYNEIRRRWGEVGSEPPPVLDPFCGGGSIPLEAQRLGLEAHGGDLNPVAVLITKAMIEIPPKFAGQPPVNPAWRAEAPERRALKAWRGAEGLAEDVRFYGQWMRDEAERRIGHLYPKVKVTEEMAKDRPDLKPLVGQELTVIAWLWARTVPSPDPAARGAHVPLVRSFALSTKKGKEAWVEPVVDTASMTYRFEVRTSSSHPGGSAPEGTIGRQGGRCLLTGAPMAFDHIRSQAKAGNMGQRMMAIVAEGSRGRVYLPPSGFQEAVARELPEFDAPASSLPEKALGFRVQAYGMTRHADLFTDRQLVALTTFSDLVGEARERVRADALAAGLDAPRAAAYADALATYLAFALNRVAMTGNSLVRWNSVGEKAQHSFGRQAIPMVWDFAEPNPLGKATGAWSAAVSLVEDPLRYLGFRPSKAEQQNATELQNGNCLFSTDPPYFDNIGYADLSDFFYVWLRRSVGGAYPKLFRTVVTPKAEELIATPYRHGGSKEAATRFFEDGLRRAFARIRRQCLPDYPVTVYYAFKQSESEEPDEDEGEEGAPTASTGWETMLQGLLDAGFAVNGTWPTRTEMKTRLVAMGTNALASCIVLACRPRPEGAGTIQRRQFAALLRQELKPALAKLTQGNVAPVDLAQAAIGPGMAVFSRYDAVLEADGTPMRVRAALALINQTLDEAMEEQEGWYDPQTRWAVTWFRQRGFNEGPYGEAETLATAKDAPVNTMVEAGILKAAAGKVKLLGRDELPADYDPAKDARTTVWEATQYLVRELEANGELGAARMMRRFRETKPDLDVERARDLAYRLFAICEQKRWPNEARAYNALVLSWSDICSVSQNDEAKWDAPATTDAKGRRKASEATLDL